MEAMIFSAGLGTRLKPLTVDRPKAMVKFLSKTMLENVIERLLKFGCKRIIINIHHFADILRKFIESLQYEGVEIIISDESDLLLDTGGGVLKAKDLFLSEDIVLYNVDVYSDLNISDLVSYHRENSSYGTLAVMSRESSRNLIFNRGMELCSWVNFKTKEEKMSRIYDRCNNFSYAFSGISVINKRILTLTKLKGKFSLIDLYLEVSKREKILGFLHSGFWADLGTMEKIKEAEKRLKYSCKKNF